jgi:hypothetical protein
VFRARFIQESRIAAATEHPNIIPASDAGEADGPAPARRAGGHRAGVLHGDQ